ncbi:MAG: hypothetical protein II350_07460 [Clostridia bacterium]|nr:hypothetical protein [Clostridia bacterium]
MRLIKYELKKLFGTPVFLIILLLLIAANTVYSENTTRLSYLEQFNAIHNDLSDLTEEEKKAYIAENLALLDFAYEIQRFSEMADSFEGGSDEAFQAAIDGKSEDFVRETLEAMENGTLTKYFPNNLRSEYFLYNNVSEAMSSTYSYETYVKDILKRAQIMLITGTVSEKNGFIYNNTNKTIKDFSDFPDVPVSYGVSEGVIAAANTPLTNVLCVVAIALAGVFVCRTERDDGLLAIVMPTRKGRLNTGYAKFATLIIAGLISCGLLLATNYGFAFFRYGFGDTSRSIQSIHEFASCTFLISVGEFLVLAFITKLLAAVVWCGIVFAAANLFRRTAISLLAYLGAFGLCAAASALPSGSRLTLLRYANPFAFFDSPTIIGKYVNINFFGAAVGIRPVCIITALAVTAVCIFFGLRAFAGMYPSATAKELRLGLRKALPKGRSVSFYEMKKLFIYRFGLAALIVALLFQINGAKNVYYPIDENETLFRSYMQKLEGPVDGTQDAFINEERQRIADAAPQLMQLEQDYTDGLMTYKEYATEQSRLKSIQSRSQAFGALESYKYSLEEQGGDTYVYPKGYEFLFNDPEKANNHVMLECIILIVGLASLFAGDFEAGTVFLLNPLPRGRVYLLRRKFSAIALFCALATLISFLPDLFTVSKEFTLGYWSASTASLPFLSALPFRMPIWLYYLLLWATRFFGACTAAMAISAIGCAVKKSGITMIASAAALLIPLAAESIGFSALTPFTLLPIQNGTVSSLGLFPSYWFAFVLYAVILALCALFVRTRFSKGIPFALRLCKKVFKKLLRKILRKNSQKKLQSPRA